jgi:acyl-coenzyme A thioesterase PaaI-like protein
MTVPQHEQELHFDSDGGCFGCSAQNPHGLHMRFWRRGDVIVSRFTVPDRFHGAPGIAHGGIVATMMDEVSCAAAVFLRQSRVVTGELSVRYRRPCPVEHPLELEALIVGEHPRYFVI